MRLKRLLREESMMACVKNPRWPSVRPAFWEVVE